MSHLGPKHFSSKNTVQLAKSLIGINLNRTFSSGATQSLRITETEAYDGPEDLACHASKGRTKRTEVMFGPAGHWYVYLIYGMHEMLNLVTGPEGYPAAILIRGLEEIDGPGRLTKRLEINRSLNGKLASPDSGLYLSHGESDVPKSHIHATPRIGIDYAGPDWSQRPYRFVWKR